MPNQQASLWTDYTWHAGPLDGFGIGFGAHYTGNTYGDQANTWLGKANAYTVFDGSVHLRPGPPGQQPQGRVGEGERHQPVQQGLPVDL